MDYFIKQHNTEYKNIKIKSVSDLKYWHDLLNPDNCYFSRDSMRFFGDTIRNYGLKNHGDLYFELYRKKPVKEGLKNSAFFCAKTLKQIISLKNFIADLAGQNCPE